MSEQSAPVPEWASFFTSERLTHFVERLEVRLATRGIRHTINVEDGYWSPTQGEIAGRRFGMVNLAQLCNQIPLDDWDREIDSFIERLMNEPENGEVPVAYDDARPMLRVRLFGEAYVEGASLVSRKYAPGFVACLAVDLPDRVVTVRPDSVAAWGRLEDDLFQVGLDNVAATSGAQVEEIETGRGKITVVQSADYFVTSLGLRPAHILGDEPAYGYLVALPNRHHALLSRVDDASSLDALPVMVNAARGMFRDGPGSVTPYVYWVRFGFWSRLEADLTDEGLGVEGPDEFIQKVLRPLLG